MMLARNKDRMGSSTNTHLCMHSTLTCAHIKRIDTGKANKRMIIYAEKTKLKTHEQQPSHLTHVYFIVYSYTANQLLLWIYSLFIPSFSLSRIAHSLCAGFSFIHVRIHIFAYLGLIVFHRQFENGCDCGRCCVAAAIKPTHMGMCSGYACVYAFYSRSFFTPHVCVYVYVCD